MNVTEFVKKYQRKIVGYPGGMYRGECLSLVKRFIEEQCGIAPPPSGVGSAWGYWDRFPDPLPDAFDKVTYEPGKMPLPGDIIIWRKTPPMLNGHIAIAVMGHKDGFIAFEQNWFSTRAALVWHDYDASIYGWLAHKEE